MNGKDKKNMSFLEYKKKLNEVAEIPEAIKCFFSEEGEDSRYAKEEIRNAKFGYKVLHPLIRVGIYALSQEYSFLSDVIDYLDGLSNDDDLSPYYTKSLDSRELFRCLKLLDEECLWIVLDRIKNFSIAENLKIAVLNNDFDLFRSIIYKKEVNTDPITPVCKLLYLKIRMDELNNWVKEKRQQADSLPNEESEETREWIREFLLQYYSKNHKIINDLNLYKESTPFTDIYFENAERTVLDDDFDMIETPPSVRDMVVYSLKKTYPSFVENGFLLNEYTDINYIGILCVFCMLKGDLRSLSTVAKVVMEGILKAEEFRPIWSRFEEFDDNMIDVLEKEQNDFLLKHGIPIDKDSLAQEESPSTPQIREPATGGPEDVPEKPQNTIERRRGRHKDSWIKGRSQIGDEEIGALIRRDVWKSLVEDVNELEFPDGVAGKERETKVRNFSAALLYYALEKIDWARRFEEYGVQESFKRTMKFANIARSSVKPYITYLHDWYEHMYAIKDSKYQLVSLFQECQADNQDMAVLFFKNLSNIGVIIEKLKVKLKKTLDDNCRL